MTDQTTFNTPLAVDVLAHIEHDPKTWNQLAWMSHSDCGTAYCYAGWACALSGVDVGAILATEDLDDQAVADEADRLLGLSGIHFLYCGSNSLNVLYRYTAELAKVDEGELRVAVKDRVVEIESA